MWRPLGSRSAICMVLLTCHSTCMFSTCNRTEQFPHQTKLTTTQAQALYGGNWNPGDSVPYSGYIFVYFRHAWYWPLEARGHASWVTSGDEHEDVQCSWIELLSPGIWSGTCWEPRLIPYSSQSSNSSQPPGLLAAWVRITSPASPLLCLPLWL